VIILDHAGNQNFGRVVLGNMDVKIKHDRLYSVFEEMMKEYSHLEYTIRSYDYWVQEKGGYVDMDVLNYYDNIDDDWETDAWILQYQDNPGDDVREEDLPILRYAGYFFKSSESMVGKHFEPLLKEWFEKTYKHKVKTVEKY
jgi:hypothetical protein